MLNKIKSLGLSLLIGSMIITSVPTTANAYDEDAEKITVKQEYAAPYKKPSKNEINKVTKMFNAMVDIDNKDFGIPYANTTTNKEVEKFMKDKELYNLAVAILQSYNQYREYNFFTYQDALNIYDGQGYELLLENHKKYKKLDNDEKYLAVYIMKYYVIKNLKVKNTANQCDECFKYFIPCKEMILMNGMNCGCEASHEEYGIKIPKLTTNGVVAVYRNEDKMRRNVLKMKAFVETENEIIVVAKTGNFADKKYVTYNKHTRKLVKQEVCGNNIGRDLYYQSLLK